MKYKKPHKREKSTSDKGHYITNAVLMEEFIKSKEQGKVTDKFALGLRLIAEKYSYHPWFIRYPYREDLISAAVETLLMNWHKFNPEKSNNLFSYYTTTCYRAFQAYKNKEVLESETKQKLLSDAGMNTSFAYQDRMGKSSDDTAFMGSNDQEIGE